MRLNISPEKWLPFVLGLNVFSIQFHSLIWNMIIQEWHTFQRDLGNTIEDRLLTYALAVMLL